jgi:hypothetical protein
MARHQQILPKVSTVAIARALLKTKQKRRTNNSKA